MLRGFNRFAGEDEKGKKKKLHFNFSRAERDLRIE
jgi:hypothetical protein